MFVDKYGEHQPKLAHFLKELYLLSHFYNLIYRNNNIFNFAMLP